MGSTLHRGWGLGASPASALPPCRGGGGQLLLRAAQWPPSHLTSQHIPPRLISFLPTIRCCFLEDLESNLCIPLFPRGVHSERSVNSLWKEHRLLRPLFPSPSSALSSYFPFPFLPSTSSLAPSAFPLLPFLKKFISNIESITDVPPPMLNSSFSLSSPSFFRCLLLWVCYGFI